jgi:hypothetical protein
VCQLKQDEIIVKFPSEMNEWKPSWISTESTPFYSKSHTISPIKGQKSINRLHLLSSSTRKIFCLRQSRPCEGIEWLFLSIFLDTVFIQSFEILGFKNAMEMNWFLHIRLWFYKPLTTKGRKLNKIGKDEGR